MPGQECFELRGLIAGFSEALSRCLSATLAGCAMLAAIAVGGCTQSAVPVATQHPTTNEPRQHVLVRFTNMSLRPSVARVLEGGTVAWTNLSSNRGGVVSFPLSVANTRPLYL